MCVSKRSLTKDVEVCLRHLRQHQYHTIKYLGQKVDWSIDRVGEYWPISRHDLEQDNGLLFQLLKNEVVIY